MKKITVRDLCNHGGQVVGRVLAGKQIVVTRDGLAVAELKLISRKPLEASVLPERSCTLPTVDGQSLRSDIDDVMDSGL